jgi:hypothetical protein
MGKLTACCSNQQEQSDNYNGRKKRVGKKEMNTMARNNLNNKIRMDSFGSALSSDDDGFKF